MKLTKLINNLFQKPQEEQQVEGYSRETDYRIFSDQELPAYLRKKHTNPETGKVDIKSAREEYARSCAEILELV